MIEEDECSTNHTHSHHNWLNIVNLKLILINSKVHLASNVRSSISFHLVNFEHTSHTNARISRHIYHHVYFGIGKNSFQFRVIYSHNKVDNNVWLKVDGCLVENNMHILVELDSNKVRVFSQCWHYLILQSEIPTIHLTYYWIWKMHHTVRI